MVVECSIAVMLTAVARWPGVERLRKRLTFWRKWKALWLAMTWSMQVAPDCAVFLSHASELQKVGHAASSESSAVGTCTKTPEAKASIQAGFLVTSH